MSLVIIGRVIIHPAIGLQHLALKRPAPNIRLNSRWLEWMVGMRAAKGSLQVTGFAAVAPDFSFWRRGKDRAVLYRSVLNQE